MQGEIVRFRKRLFGGFNRDDVVAYIAGKAEEQNKCIAEKENAEREAEMLRGELKKLQEKLGLYEKLIEKLRSRKRGAASDPAHRNVQQGVTPQDPAHKPGNARQKHKSVIRIIRKKI